MPDQPFARSASVRTRPPFDRIALLLQGGGALGSYQAGVYEALADANLHQAVTANPYLALGIAAGIGLLLGALTRR